MYRGLLFSVICGAAMVASGCNSTPADNSESPDISTATGGFGSGPTGTGGGEPADNPAADAPGANGTGGP